MRARGVFFGVWLFVWLFPAFVLSAQLRLPKAKTILDYSKELALSDRQVEKIKAHLYDLQRKFGDLKLKLAVVEGQIRSSLREGMAKKGQFDLDAVKAKIREAYRIRAEMAIAEVETARKINAVLTEKQFEKWQKIVSEALARGRTMPRPLKRR